MITKFWFELNEKITYASIERPPKKPRYSCECRNGYTNLRGSQIVTRYDISGIGYKGSLNLSRRSRLDIYFDVLELIGNGTDIPTRIIYETSLSWEVGSNVFDTLIRSGFIWEKKEKESVRYNLTTKGRNVLSYYWKALENLV